MTSLGCAACGGCCDPVHLSESSRLNIERLAALDLAELNEPTRADVEFTAEHWTEIRRDPDGGAAYSCDRYDPNTRLCTAHDDRPPVCRNYPFYGRPGDPSSLGLTPGGGPDCSYWLDVPAADRPDKTRPLIPLTVLR